MYTWILGLLLCCCSMNGGFSAPSSPDYQPIAENLEVSQPPKIASFMIEGKLREQNRIGHAFSLHSMCRD